MAPFVEREGKHIAQAHRSSDCSRRVAEQPWREWRLQMSLDD